MAQVDWGAYETVAVDNIRRRLSFFVIVLALSLQMYVEFTISQTREHFLAWQHYLKPAVLIVDELVGQLLEFDFL